MPGVQVIGTGLGYEDLTARHLEIIQDSHVLVGGQEQLDWFPGHPGIKRRITSPLDDLIQDIRNWMLDRQVAVLASGDPLFYGIGRRLILDLGADHLEVHPNISVMAGAFARIRTPWDQAAWVSLHGRSHSHLLAALDSGRPLFVFTDPRNSPARAAQILEQNKSAGWSMCVLERLGRPDERVRWFSPAEAADEEFMEPNALILFPAPEKPQEPRVLTLGTPDHFYLHQRGMITKSEVRAVSLAKLGLEPGHVFWDLGSASGSMAIEAAMFTTGGRIVAVEKDPERISHIRENIRRFQTPGVEVLQMDLPEGIQDLPPPDRVFIGGGGEDLPEIIRQTARILKPGGRIVLNLVVFETLHKAVEILNSLDFSTEVIQVQISRGRQMPGGVRLQAQNPVFVLSALPRNVEEA
ncbi:precorrin-6y C5,15-methyltransferase (decarboxylating), CbiE subunit [Desulfonatronospira thiodismutans ASO3-1]|uniref:Precorrin-6y C5,15-methyltransferase (Decarboxylating), CbiE subunit n=1 Tax=Desulfonatronospira thiodismutans ASO3-1 TaxID=555779 RepID=D6ST56_9BACT|nr:bifunctional cobalt-precorrin-7 (C(5))-methyltransferase/cobalt-precorrin-6B (C(15))-methyltransferase [Desulfonatronospira thiodismutans]EFI33872.1 precorrin-6y C5,15-methyltransferase (decarboxylating), CbiE subunit [Desulfonatronospira thiodismutans ASO3-1]